MKKSFVASFLAVLFCISLSVSAVAEPIVPEVEEDMAAPRIVMNHEARGDTSKTVSINGRSYTISFGAASKGTYHDYNGQFITCQVYAWYINNDLSQIPGTVTFDVTRQPGTGSTYQEFNAKLTVKWANSAGGGQETYNYTGTIRSNSSTITWANR